ncbi:hypothetical protein ANCCAN_21734 [Ancylostoma caninum]|uniref:Uncharacterized protein n=1 Tax=Ancylostoma caninum TaxID=29170 RepID=A0A368FJQ1_ANCCA|nr:hypothetical protein ANCCAN_21734 [Ancylostoma caninum]
MLWLFVHFTQCVCFLGSAISAIYPTKLPKLRNAASVGHLLVGTSLLLVPGQYLAITVQGSFNTLHAFLQAYSAPFHLGLAYFLLSPSGLPQQKPFVFAQAFCALMSLFTRLLTAWHLAEKSTRGLLISDHFILCSFLTDGAWLINEVVTLVTAKRTKQDEIDQMCKRTTLWLEGKGSFYLENAFYIDAAICLLTAFMHFAFPQHILKLVVSLICCEFLFKKFVFRILFSFFEHTDDWSVIWIQFFSFSCIFFKPSKHLTNNKSCSVEGHHV